MAVERSKCKEKYTKKSKSPACFEGFVLSLSKFAISFWNIFIPKISFVSPSVLVKPP